MKNRKSLLVTLADRNYLNNAKQLFSSVFWNAGWDGDYMLLAHEIPEKELEWFIGKGILVKRCAPLHHRDIGRENYAPVVLDKFYLFTPEFQKWDNVVFLDADIIVKASINELAKVKGFASPNVMGDTLELFFQKNSDPSLYKTIKEEYSLRSPAFNSGVMAFSTRIIQKTTFDSLMELFIKYETIASSDDPIFNLLFYKRWIKLSVVYDITPRLIERKTGLNPGKLRGIIIHLKDDELSDLNSSLYREWKKNLELAENINLKNIQKVKKWTIFQIKYYTLFLNTLRPLYFVCKKVKFFYRHRLKPFFMYIIYTPDRLIGKAGACMEKNTPDLYHKLRRIKGGK